MAPSIRLLALALVFCVCAGPLRAADPLGTWTTISDPVIAQLAAKGLQPGYPGQTAGVSVDRITGDVYLVICDQGLWRSEDRGAAFQRVDGGAVGGRCEYGFSLDPDPTSSRLMCYMIYGGSALVGDRGKSHAASSASHLDFGATDWSDGKTMIAVHHESGGKACISTNGGGDWHDLSTGFRCVGVFDAKTFVAGKDDRPGTVRSSDGGATWSTVSELSPKGRAMRVFTVNGKSKGYWTTARGVMVSDDQGATWSLLGTSVDASDGPYFGRDDSHLLVVTRAGLMETSDACATWRLAAPLPSPTAFSDSSQFTTYGWDWRNEIFYYSAMGGPTLKYQFQPAKEDLAKADQLLAQVDKISDAASPARLDALIKLDIGTAALGLDAPRRLRISELTTDVHAEMMRHQGAVRDALAEHDTKTADHSSIDKLIAEHAKPYARTSLAGWFSDARALLKAKRGVAQLMRENRSGLSPAAKHQLGDQLDELAKKTGASEFRQELERMANDARR